MALPIEFTRERIAHVLNCLANGRYVAPSDNAGWTKNDMLLLAGACSFGVLSQGPVLLPGADLSLKSTERREFIDNQFLNDIRAATEFYGRVAMYLEDGEYDIYFDEDVSGIIEHREGQPSAIMPVRGFRASLE